MIVERIEFQTAAQLIAAIERIAGGILDLETLYVKDVEDNYIGQVELEQETLTDGSIAYNIILSEGGTPDE